MVNHGQKPGVRRRYLLENLAKALKMVQEEGASISKAAMFYKVPRTTLTDKVRERSCMDCAIGAKTVLTKNEEEKLVDWIIERARSGNPCTTTDLRNKAQALINVATRFNPFPNNLPGKSWVFGIVSRHSLKIEMVQGNVGRPSVLYPKGEVPCSYTSSKPRPKSDVENSKEIQRKKQNGNFDLELEKKRKKLRKKKRLQRKMLAT
ncbi:uncharacterized protein [Apostichopus japonicus]|uniref:uncharacterized protein n=1 Tax=Stichopus japonicus TaxID=307972 RepID=UPI003AB10BB7